VQHQVKALILSFVSTSAGAVRQALNVCVPSPAASLVPSAALLVLQDVFMPPRF